MSELDYRRIKCVVGKHIKIVSHNGVTVENLNESLKEDLVSKGFNLSEIRENEYFIYI